MSLFNRAEAHSFTIKEKNVESTFFYWTSGNPQSPKLLVIPGFAGTHKDFSALHRELRDAFFVIVPDLPGWGASDTLKKNATIANYAKFLTQLLNHLEIKKTHILGHCMGAPIGIELAIHQPSTVASLILISTPYEEQNLVHRLCVKMADLEQRYPSLYPLLYFWKNKFFAFVTAPFVYKFKSFKKILVYSAKNLTNDDAPDLNVLKQNWRSLMHFNYKKISTLTLPIYLLYGSKDVYVSEEHSRAFANLVPHAQLEFIPEAGHLPNIETPATAANLVKTYIKNIE